MKEPTTQEVWRLVTFERDGDGVLYVVGVLGNVRGNVLGAVSGDVCCTIKGRYWRFVETPKEKAIRLIEEGRGDEAIKVLQEGE